MSIGIDSVHIWVFDVPGNTKVILQLAFCPGVAFWARPNSNPEDQSNLVVSTLTPDSSCCFFSCEQTATAPVNFGSLRSSTSQSHYLCISFLFL